jgi:short-subunit dehydrogenase
MDAADVARIGLRALARGRAWVVAGARNKLAAFLLGLLPRAAAPALMKASLDGLLSEEGR